LATWLCDHVTGDASVVAEVPATAEGRSFWEVRAYFGTEK